MKDNRFITLVKYLPLIFILTSGLLHGQRDTTMTIKVLGIDTIDPHYYFTFEIVNDQSGDTVDINKLWFAISDRKSFKKLSKGKPVTVRVAPHGPERGHGGSKTIYVSNGQVLSRIHRYHLEEIIEF